MNLKNSIGVFGSFNLNNHIAKFRKLPTIANCCEDFTNIFNTGISIGASYEIPTSNEWKLRFICSFETFETSFKAQQSTPILLDGNLSTGMFEHQLTARMNIINIGVSSGYKLFDNFFLYGGINIGIDFKNNFFQQEMLIIPDSRGTFLEGTRIRNQFSGTIPQATNPLLGLNLGAGYDLPMNKKHYVLLSPRIDLQYNVNNFVQNTSWNYFSAKLGIEIKFKSPPMPPPPPPPPLLPPYQWELVDPKEPPKATISLSVIEIDENEKPKPSIGLKIEDFVSLNVRPLLNYVFFDKNSSTIPNRYHKLSKDESEKFNLKDLQQLDAIRTYYHVLNIFGKRLKDNPQVKIRIVGCNSNIDVEKNNSELSKARALSVFNYLKDIWEIDANRMKLEYHNLPDQHSKSDTLPGQEENMRVEIISKDEAITEPVLTVDTLRIINPTTFRFLPKVNGKIGVKNWNLIVTQNGKEMYKANGLNSIPENLDWKIFNDDANSPRNSLPLVYKFTVTDSLNQTYSTESENIPIEQLTVDRKRLERQSDKEFEYYSLILFDYGKSNLGAEHKKTVDFVKSRITKEAKVYIYGHTDAMGNYDVNSKISTTRAKAVSKRLGLKNALVEGKGENELLYDNSLPEGRFYCRTVRITVESEIK